MGGRGGGAPGRNKPFALLRLSGLSPVSSRADVKQLLASVGVFSGALATRPYRSERELMHYWMIGVESLEVGRRVYEGLHGKSLGARTAQKYKYKYKIYL